MRPPKPPEQRVNERIKAKEIRLIDDDGEQLGLKTVEEAILYAQEKGLDLVEVAPKANPPVCRIMDYGKFRYEKLKREREAAKKQRHTSMKEVKFRPKIDVHDYQVKLRMVRRFIEAGHKVKVTVMFRGREMSRRHELGRKITDRLNTDIEDVASVERQPKNEGRNTIMILMPKP
jgi:translation initiation factor IF-3